MLNKNTAECTLEKNHRNYKLISPSQNNFLMESILLIIAENGLYQLEEHHLQALDKFF